MRLQARSGVGLFGLLGLLGLLAPGAALAVAPGETVTTVAVRDANNKPASLPDLGKKVLALFYTDPDVKDQNEPFRDLLKAAKLDRGRYRGLGVVNLKDTWKPNFIVRKVVRGKIEKFKALILTDVNHTLKKAWRLGDCDDKDVVIIIGKDRKVRFMRAGALTQAEQRQALALIRRLMAS